MTTPTRVSAGTPVGRLFRASTINYVLEGAELSHKLATGELGSGRAADRGNKVLVRNDTGETLRERFRVLGLTDILIDPGDSDEAARQFKEHFAFIGEKPDAVRDGPGRIAITQAPVEDGKLVQCIITGPTVGYLELDDDETYTSATIETDQHEKLIASTGGEIVVLWHETGPGTKLAVFNLSASVPCPYYWEIYIENGSAPPSSGSSIFSVTLDADTQDVTVDYDMTAAELSSELLSEFTALEAGDIEVTGGPLPVFPLYVQWKGDFTGHASEDYPPTAGTNSLNNSSQMKIRQINPRA